MDGTGYGHEEAQQSFTRSSWPLEALESADYERLQEAAQQATCDFSEQHTANIC